MELKEVQDELTKIKITEEITTVEFIKKIFGKHMTTLDISNHYIFDKSASILVKLLKSYFSVKKDLKSLILQNCMITSKSLKKIIKVLISNSKSFKILDISNNRLELDSSLTSNLSLLLSKTMKLKHLKLQGNICENSQALAKLFTFDIRLTELNLYDTNLSKECLAVLASVLEANRTILNLNLGYNDDAFEDLDVVAAFANSVGENKCIEELNLSGNENLGNTDNLRQLSEGLKSNKSLSILRLGGINLSDFGIKLLTTTLLQELPISYLDIQNNNIQDSGFKALIAELPETLSGLDFSYNSVRDNSSLVNFSHFLTETKSLRRLNISHSFELESVESSILDLLCESLKKNDSLSDLMCEGVKISDDPDSFCLKLNQAIGNRKLSLTYKISAVNCVFNRSSVVSLMSYEKSMKFISNVPSNLSQFKQVESYSQTARNEFVDTPDQDPIVNTSRHFDLSNSL